jgi:hypothetical protein
MLQRFLVPLFTFVWWSRLFDEEPGAHMYRSHVVKVKGWRTALIDAPGGRRSVMFMFWWEKED